MCRASSGTTACALPDRYGSSGRAVPERCAMIAVAPSIVDIRAARERLAGRVRVTPVLEVPLSDLDSTWPLECTALFKLELFQLTGTFKVRGALNGMLGLSAEHKRRGVTTVSAGNHAVAVAYAARALGISAK